MLKNIDCNGDCLIDSDGDGVCDELEVLGCTDPEALNYNEEATEDDGSCEYPPNYEGVIVINEINYNPASSYDQGDTQYEFVELFNNSPDDVNLVGWNFSSTNIDFTFDDVSLGSNEYLVLARTAETYPGSIEHGGTSLLNNGETLTLTDNYNQLVDLVTYSDGFQGDDDSWPQEADAEGSTLELIDANFNNNVPESWQASLVIPGGTPGLPNSSNEEQYFQLDIDDTGDYQLVIFENTITGLDSGDEIGIFDANGVIESCNPDEGCTDPILGEVLVGSGIWLSLIHI